MLWEFIAQHWISGLVGIIGGILAWVASNAFGKPLTDFWSDRREVLQTIEEHWRVSTTSSQKRTEEALEHLRKASSILAAHDSANSIAINVYCWARCYDLAMASQLVRGISAHIAEGYDVNEIRKNNMEAARLKLGATRGMTKARRAELKKLVEEKR
ncbi:hypothetical protein [Reyranella soli]|uniref:Uncharacterized protein n=1 Tax=Reyranella soli TaxID=1230389 RepID=A0A512N5F7_9HYPH|nr:hypothetical protein [Reyranella soli]GEP54173.1 hypothetical protein RSO01_13390 [Reyranella soli]